VRCRLTRQREWVAGGAIGGGYVKHDGVGSKVGVSLALDHVQP